MLAALHQLPLLPPSLSLPLSKTWRAEGIHRQVLNVKEKTKSTKARLDKATSTHFSSGYRNLAKRKFKMAKNMFFFFFFLGGLLVLTFVQFLLKYSRISILGPSM
jgi:hypothetical protein